MGGRGEERDERLDALPSVGRLIAKAAVTSLGRPGASGGLPVRSVSVAGVRQPVGRLAAYDRLCGFTLRDRVPPTWLHVLTFPLQAHLMAARDFPFPLAGLVHVTNDMTLRRPVELREELLLRVRTRNLAAHKRGVTFDMLGEASVGGEVVWTGVSNYLATGASGEGLPEASGGSGVRIDEPDADDRALWRLPPDLGRRYAGVSGDTNPIHLSPLTSRLFGFPRPIIHGMWTHARALAQLDARLPDAYRVQVRFTRPIMLPAAVTFAAETADAPRFVVRSREGRAHLIGRVSEPDAA